MQEPDFIQMLSKQEQTFTDARKFEAIQAGNYFLNIQASKLHYCTPRKNLKADKYTSMQLEVWNKNGWIYMSRSKCLRAFKRYTELLTYKDPKNPEFKVFAYVPIDLINDLYIYLKNYKF